MRFMYTPGIHVFIYVISFSQVVKARGNVETWLGFVEESMMVSLRRLTKAAIGDFESKPRHKWATQHPSQVSVCNSTRDCSR